MIGSDEIVYVEQVISVFSYFNATPSLLKHSIQSKFEKCLTAEEDANDKLWQQQLTQNYKLLMARVSEKSGVEMIFDPPRKGNILPQVTSIQEMKVMVKYPYLLSLEEGRILSRSASTLLLNDNFTKSKQLQEEYLKLSQRSLEKFEEALRMNPNDIRSIYNIGLSYLEQALYMKSQLSKEKVTFFLSQSKLKFDEVLELNPNHMYVRKFLIALSDLVNFRVKSNGYYRKCLEALIQVSGKDEEKKLKEKLKELGPR